MFNLNDNCLKLMISILGRSSCREEGTRRPCETSSIFVATYVDDPKHYLFLSKGDSMTVEFSFLLLSFFRERCGKFIQSSSFIWGHICYFPIDREQLVPFHDFLQP